MRTIKLVIIGDSGVGKTSLRNQYIMGRFSTGYRATIGTDFITKTLPHYQNPEESVTLQIWDTAGQERFSSLSTAFFRGADAALLMFDVNRPETLNALSKWWDEFKAHAPVPDEEAEDFCCVVVGNKIDLAEGEEMQAEPIGGGSKGEHARVSEAEAERFLEELVPRRPTSNDEEGCEYEYDDSDDPFVVHEDQSRRTTGLFMRRSVSGFSLHSVMHPHFEPEDQGESDNEPDPPPLTQTQSISIQPGSSYKHPFRKRVQKSRSSERSQLGGTMTTTHTTQTLYHTPSSSLFDAFESAPSSPLHHDHDHPPSPGSVAGEPSTMSTRAPRRTASASSSSSAPTITPSLFMRAQASASTSAAPTPPTPIECSSDFPFTPATAVRSRQRGPPLPPRPERRPRLFLASAKTGIGVAPVFEHIARRVAMRWTYAEALEARAVRVHEPSAATETLRLGLSGSSSGSRVASFRERLASGTSCCGS